MVRSFLRSLARNAIRQVVEEVLDARIVVRPRFYAVAYKYRRGPLSNAMTLSFLFGNRPDAEAHLRSMPGGVQHSDEGDFIIVEVADFRIL